MILEPEMMRKIADMSEKYKMSFFRVLTWFAENDNLEITEQDAAKRVDKLLVELQNWKEENTEK